MLGYVRPVAVILKIREGLLEEVPTLLDAGGDGLLLPPPPPQPPGHATVDEVSRAMGCDHVGVDIGDA